METRHDCVHRNQLLDPTPRQMNAVHALFKVPSHLRLHPSSAFFRRLFNLEI
jgi:hypothetical protein